MLLIPIAVVAAVYPGTLTLTLYEVVTLIFVAFMVGNSTFFGIRLIRKLKHIGMNPIIGDFLKRVSCLRYNRFKNFEFI
jgi:hypothetical protein